MSMRGCTCRPSSRCWIRGRCEACDADLAEVQIQDAIRLAVGSDPRVVLWRNNSGVARTERGMIRYGVANPGGADLIGIFNGRFLAIEVKSRTGRTSTEQERFGALVRAKGGIFILARDVETVLEVLNSEEKLDQQRSEWTASSGELRCQSCGVLWKKHNTRC